MLGALQRNSLIAMTSGLLLWTLYFLFSYAFLSLGCALGFSGVDLAGINLIHLVILLATALTLAAIVFLAFGAWQQKKQLSRQAVEGVPGSSLIPRQRFMTVMALLIHGISLVAVLWVAAPVLMRIPPCL